MSLTRRTELPTMRSDAWGLYAATRQTGFGEFMGANLAEGAANTVPGMIARETSIERGARPDGSTTPQSGQSARGASIAQDRMQEQGRIALSEDEWRTSPHFRETLDFDPNLTADGHARRAQIADSIAYRQTLIARREAGVFDGLAGFAAQMVGTAIDPVNYVPLGGQAVRASMTARMMRAGASTRAAAILPAVASNAAEGALGNLAVSPAIMNARERFGEDVGWIDVLTDVAMGAALGGALGGAVGALDARRISRSRANLEATRETLAALDVAARDLAEGRPVDLSGIRVDRIARAVGARPEPIETRMRREASSEIVDPNPRRAVSTVAARGSGWTVAATAPDRVSSVAPVAGQRIVVDADGLMAAPPPGARRLSPEDRDSVPDVLRDPETVERVNDRGRDIIRFKRGDVTVEVDQAGTGTLGVVRAYAGEPRRGRAAGPADPVAPDAVRTEGDARPANDDVAADAMPAALDVPSAETPLAPAYVREGLRYSATTTMEEAADDLLSADAAVGKPVPQNVQAMARDLGVDEGDIATDARVDYLRKQGLLSEADEAGIAEAAEVQARANAYEEAYRTAMACIVRSAA